MLSKIGMIIQFQMAGGAQCNKSQKNQKFLSAKGKRGGEAEHFLLAFDTLEKLRAAPYHTAIL